MGFEPSLGRVAYSEVLEDYLKKIFLLMGKKGRVTTSDLARSFNVAPSTVTQTLKRLSQLKLIHHTPYYGVQLTPRGERLALELVRHHRLLELFLERTMGLPWERVHAEADRLEHVISEEMEECLARHLGDPLYDPHGAPIPSRNLQFPREPSLLLAELPIGVKATITAIEDEETKLLIFARAHDLLPGSSLELKEKNNDEIRVELEKGPLLTVPIVYAFQIWVRQKESPSDPRDQEGR